MEQSRPQHRCNELVQEALTHTRPADVVQAIDDISDVVCQTYDAAEFCRNVHTDHAWRTAAQSTCMELGAYIGQLNTHPGLYHALLRAMQRDDDVRSRPHAPHDVLSEEGLLVAAMLRRDFEKHGIHLAETAREDLVHLTVAASHVGMQIGANLIDAEALGTIPLTPRQHATAASLLTDPSAVLHPLLPQRNTPASLVASSVACGQLLSCADDAALRAKVYAAMGASPAANEALVQQLVDLRRATARVLGARSYTASQTEGFSLAGRPEAAEAFLLQLLDALRPRARGEVAELAAVKQRLTGEGEVAPWDRQYLVAVQRATVCDVASAAVAQYLCLDACLVGLSALLQRLMGLTLSPVAFGSGEAWAPGVSKWAVSHEVEGFLGHIYLDLAARPGKCPGAAHFTLRSGRRLPSGTYQTPLVALVCNFAVQGGRVQLSHGEVQTLYHEFGHALHSLLSRTEYQHLAGTRGAMDMVEVPSHWMERFASDPVCLAMWARHAGTGDPLPTELAERMQRSERMFWALSTQHQALLALVDLRLHGAGPLPPGGVTEIVRDAFAEHASIPPPPEHKLQLRFGHLVGYGGGYYAYLYAHALARGIWRKHHDAADPCNREAGERVRRHLLKPGGATRPRDMIVGLQGEGALQALEGGWAPALEDALP